LIHLRLTLSLVIIYFLIHWVSILLSECVSDICWAHSLVLVGLLVALLLLELNIFSLEMHGTSFCKLGRSESLSLPCFILSRLLLVLVDNMVCAQDSLPLAILWAKNAFQSLDWIKLLLGHVEVSHGLLHHALGLIHDGGGTPSNSSVITSAEKAISSAWWESSLIPRSRYRWHCHTSWSKRHRRGILWNQVRSLSSFSCGST